MFDRLRLEDLDESLPALPMIRKGVTDLVEGTFSEEALLVTIAAPRLRFLGLEIPPPPPLPEDAEMVLYSMLLDQGRADAYSYYNSLIRALLSFSQSLERQRGAELRVAELLP